MKNLASALALTVAAFAVQAQNGSSVTMYGALDVNINSFSAGSMAGGQSVTRLTDGTSLGGRPSRFGIRVLEDLGGGMSAGAVLEHGINVDTGTLGQGGRAWGRQAYVFLSNKSVGELRMGRQYIESDFSVLPVGIPFGNTLATKASVLISGPGFALPVALDIAARADNTIEYRTPAFNGFNAVFQVAPGEGTADRFHGVSGVYASPTLSAAAAYEWNKDRNTGRSLNKVITVSSAYNFGPFKLRGALQSGKELANTSLNGTASAVSFVVPTTNAGPGFTATKLDMRIIGIEVPVGATTLGSSIIQTRYKGALGQTTKYNRLGFAASHDLSKRTGVYLGISFAGGDMKEYILEKRIVQAGVRHVF